MSEISTVKIGENIGCGVELIKVLKFVEPIARALEKIKVFKTGRIP